MLTDRRFLLLVAVGLVIAAAVAYGSSWVGTDAASASDGGPEMRLVIKEGAACDGDTCTVPRGASFTLAVEIVTIPDGGYVLLQSFIVYGPDLVYQRPKVWNSEYTNPDCVPTIRVGPSAPAGAVSHGCLTGLIPPLPVSTYTGNYIELKMSCPGADSTTELQLLPNGDPLAGTKGALFKRPDDTSVIPKVNNLTVHCGSGQGPTETPGPPTETPSPTPTNPPTPTLNRFVIGDANCDGAVDAKDASLVLQLEAGLISALACRDSADVNGDGLVNSLDAVLILQFEARLVQQLPAGNTG